MRILLLIAFVILGSSQTFARPRLGWSKYDSIDDYDEYDTRDVRLFTYNDYDYNSGEKFNWPKSLQNLFNDDDNFKPTATFSDEITKNDEKKFIDDTDDTDTLPDDDVDINLLNSQNEDDGKNVNYKIYDSQEIPEVVSSPADVDLQENKKDSSTVDTQFYSHGFPRLTRKISTVASNEDEDSDSLEDEVSVEDDENEDDDDEDFIPDESEEDEDDDDDEADNEKDEDADMEDEDADEENEVDEDEDNEDDDDDDNDFVPEESEEDEDDDDTDEEEKEDVDEDEDDDDEEDDENDITDEDDEDNGNFIFKEDENVRGRDKYKGADEEEDDDDEDEDEEVEDGYDFVPDEDKEDDDENDKNNENNMDEDDEEDDDDVDNDDEEDDYNDDDEGNHKKENMCPPIFSYPGLNKASQVSNADRRNDCKNSVAPTISQHVHLTSNSELLANELQVDVLDFLMAQKHLKDAINELTAKNEKIYEQFHATLNDRSSYNGPKHRGIEGELSEMLHSVDQLKGKILEMQQLEQKYNNHMLLNAVISEMYGKSKKF